MPYYPNRRPLYKYYNQINKPQPQKKKILSNRSLTKEVRSLRNQEGERVIKQFQTDVASLLTAGTALIRYFDDSSAFTTGVTVKHHYYDCHLKLLCSTAGGATVRILYCFDESWDGTNLVVGEILDSTADSASPYLDDAVTNLKEARHKNRSNDYRCVVVKDKLIALNNGEPKCLSFRLPLFKRRTCGTTSPNVASFYPFMLFLADEANVTMSFEGSYVYTNLSN